MDPDICTEPGSWTEGLEDEEGPGLPSLCSTRRTRGLLAGQPMRLGGRRAPWVAPKLSSATLPGARFLLALPGSLSLGHGGGGWALP